MMEKKAYLPEEAAFIEELVEDYGMPESAAEDCLASRNSEERKVVLAFLRRYGRMIKVTQ